MSTIDVRPPKYRRGSLLMNLLETGSQMVENAKEFIEEVVADEDS